MNQVKQKTESELHQEVHRAQQVEMILNHALVKEYFDKKEQAILHNLKTCKHWKNAEERDALLNMLQCFADFEKEFKRHIAQGQKAKFSLKQLFKGKS